MDWWFGYWDENLSLWDGVLNVIECFGVDEFCCWNEGDVGVLWCWVRCSIVCE